ncbi:sterol desaturase family protein [Acinetobacter oleivorans]|uniref:sterol desaturase family protein n=1 Tax=Acinetobacter oleivorans TaxID=1148157 RepID=UPI001901B2B7|nr:sterol desaturase family protein [Acinetobacter oleivorans]MBJ9739608.1 sterol desaturase family protein [Acinetobacter oleivorans]MCU4411970.1 sterol desaturase family protein [Acinetobacter oleivorans]
MVSKLLQYALPVMFMLMILEVWISHTRKLYLYSFADFFSNLSIGLLSQIFVPLTRLVRVGLYIWIYKYLALIKWPTDKLIVWIIGLLLYDFMYYWQHRIMHTFNIFWAIHSVHHQSNHFNMSISLRQPVLGGLIAGIFYLPMALIGIPPIIFAVVSTIDLLYQYCLHTQLIGKLKYFDRIIATPSNHRVHHGVNSKYINKNFGGMLIIWDRFFGTFAEEDIKINTRFGTHKPLVNYNPIWANLHGFIILFNFKSIENFKEIILKKIFKKRSKNVKIWLPCSNCLKKQTYFYISVQFVVLIALMGSALFYKLINNINLYLFIFVWTIVTLCCLTNLLDQQLKGFWWEIIRISTLLFICGVMIFINMWFVHAVIIFLISLISIVWLSKILFYEK